MEVTRMIGVEPKSAALQQCRVDVLIQQEGRGGFPSLAIHCHHKGPVCRRRFVEDKDHRSQGVNPSANA